MSTLVAGMCSICCHMTLVFAFMHLYPIFNLQLSMPILLYIFQSGTETPDRNGQWCQHLLTLVVMFYKSNTEGTNFRIIFVCFAFVYCACFVLCSTVAGLELVKRPEVTLCG